MQTLNVRLLLPDSSYIREEGLYKFFKPIYKLGLLDSVQEHKVDFDAVSRTWSLSVDTVDINLEIQQTKVLNNAIIQSINIENYAS